MAAPVEYITIADLQGYIPGEDIEGRSETALQVLIAAGRELIDSHFGSHFPDPVPALVQSVNMELVRAMCADTSKNSENIDGYSYANNHAAIAQILARLDLLKTPEGDQSLLERGKQVTVRVV